LAEEVRSRQASVPILEQGDWFDIGFKANLRNAELLRRWAEE